MNMGLAIVQGMHAFSTHSQSQSVVQWSGFRVGGGDTSMLQLITQQPRVLGGGGERKHSILHTT